MGLYQQAGGAKFISVNIGQREASSGYLVSPENRLVVAAYYMYVVCRSLPAEVFLLTAPATTCVGRLTSETADVDITVDAWRCG